MKLDDIVRNTVLETIEKMELEFYTKDLSNHPDMLSAHANFIEESHYHSIVGKYLKREFHPLIIEEIKKGTSKGSLWQRKSPSDRPKSEAIIKQNVKQNRLGWISRQKGTLWTFLVTILGLFLAFLALFPDEERAEMLRNVGLLSQPATVTATSSKITNTPIMLSPVLALNTLASSATPTPSSTAQPLQRDSGVIFVTDYRENGSSISYGYSFEQNQPASQGVPADITLERCSLSFGELRCNIHASNLLILGSISLSDVIELNNFIDKFNECPSNGCKISNGDTYIIDNYLGKLTKFRIQNIDIISEDNTFTISVEWVIQPNDRQDFYEK